MYPTEYGSMYPTYDQLANTNWHLTALSLTFGVVFLATFAAFWFTACVVCKERDSARSELEELQATNRELAAKREYLEGLLHRIQKMTKVDYTEADKSPPSWREIDNEILTTARKRLVSFKPLEACNPTKENEHSDMP